MPKFVVLLAVYAAVVSTLLLYESRQPTPLGSSSELQASSGARTGAPFLNPRDSSDEQVRLVLYEVRKLLREQIAQALEDVDWRLSRIESLREATEEGLEVAERTATEAGRSSFSRLSAMDKQLKEMGHTSALLEDLRKTLASVTGRLVSLEERPAQIIREVGVGNGTPARHKEPEAQKPPVRTLPGPRRKDPEVVRAEVAQARKDLVSKDLSVLFPAIEKVREHRVLAAVPRLLEILSTFPEEFGRSAAAGALGSMKIADAIPALAEAIVDRSGLVAQQANKSVRQITGFDSEMSPSARVRERRTVRNRVKDWWRMHEQEVRERLHQPATTGGGGG